MTPIRSRQGAAASNEATPCCDSKLGAGVRSSTAWYFTTPLARYPAQSYREGQALNDRRYFNTPKP